MNASLVEFSLWIQGTAWSKHYNCCLPLFMQSGGQPLVSDFFSLGEIFWSKKPAN